MHKRKEQVKVIKTLKFRVPSNINWNIITPL